MTLRVLSLLLGLFLCEASRANHTLIRAIEKGDFPTVLVSNHSDVTITPNPLIHALSLGQYQIALFLLEKGSRSDIEDMNGDTPLILSVKNHLLTRRMLEHILRNGASIEHAHEKTGMTAIMYAVKAGYVKGVELLSDYGASIDRINVKDQKGALAYAQDDEMVEYLMKSHRYFAKSLKRFGFELLYDANGFAQKLAMGADGVLFRVKKGDDFKIAKFCYVRELFQQYGILEYRKCKDQEDQMARLWRTWFANKLEVENLDLFYLKKHIKGKTLAQWMTGIDVEHDFGAESARADFARKRLRELIVRMLKADQGFVGDMNASNLIFSEEDGEWIVIDGRKAVACYSPADHEWIWVEYCKASLDENKESLLKAFQSYAIGPNPTGKGSDSESFGVWLMDRLINGQMEGPTPSAREKMIELIHSICPADLN